MLMKSSLATDHPLRPCYCPSASVSMGVLMGQLPLNGGVPHWQAAATTLLSVDAWVVSFMVLDCRFHTLDTLARRITSSCKTWGFLQPAVTLPFRPRSGTFCYTRFCEQKGQHCTEFCLKAGYPQIPDFISIMILPIQSISWYRAIFGQTHIEYHTESYFWLISHHVPTNRKWSIMLP